MCVHASTHLGFKKGWKLWVVELWVIFITSFLSLLSKCSTWNMSDFRKRFETVKQAALDPLVPHPFLFQAAPSACPHPWARTIETSLGAWVLQPPHNTHPEACLSQGQRNLKPRNLCSISHNTFTAAEAAVVYLNGHSRGGGGKLRLFYMGVYCTDIKIMFTATLGNVYAEWNE